MNLVYTLTLNPALDHIIYLSEMKEGGRNRTSREYLEVGGKGINVSLELAELDIKSRALGFVAGFTGYEIERQLQERGVETDFVWLENGLSRINVKLKNYGYDSKITQTSLNSDGPEISDNALSQLFSKLGAITDGDVLILSGSVPSGLPNDIYAQVLEFLAGKKIKAAVDTQGEALASTLAYRPFLIKTDLDELGRMFGERPASMLEAAGCASNLREMGAGNILISMTDGALFVDENGGTHFCGACKGKVRNTMGTGDAMLAGFLSGALDDDTDMEYALLLGAAASGATAFSDGIAKKDDILDQLKILLKGNV